MVQETTPSAFSASSSEDCCAHRLNQINASILFVILLFPISTAVTVWTLSTLPISIPWPRNISDLAQLGRELQGYSRSGTWPLIHVALVMSLSAIWKHAWSIPGSVFWVCGGTIVQCFYRVTFLLISILFSLLSRMSWLVHYSPPFWRLFYLQR